MKKQIKRKMIEIKLVRGLVEGFLWDLLFLLCVNRKIKWFWMSFAVWRDFSFKYLNGGLGWWTLGIRDELLSFNSRTHDWSAEDRVLATRMDVQNFWWIFLAWSDSSCYATDGAHLPLTHLRQICLSHQQIRPKSLFIELQHFS